MTTTKSLKKQVPYTILLLLTISFTSALTVQELVESYDFDYYNGSINVTSQTDYMVDRDSDGTDDTLIINLTTDVTSGTYIVLVEISDGDEIIANSTNKTFSAGNSIASVSFDASLFTNSRFNYSVIINNNEEELVYRKYRIETNAYSGYEKGTNITGYADENVNNGLLRINITINSTETATRNITAVLLYNDSTISATKEQSLTNGIQAVSVDFDNETIKSTHYNGNFTLVSVTIGEKPFSVNYSTSAYNYEDFAKTSYIKSYADSLVDLNANNLSEFLEINLTINVKTSDTYKINYELYDEFDNFVAAVEKNQSLSTGNQVVQTLINGSKIYKTKVNGPYKLSFAKLSIGNVTKDIAYRPYVTNLTYYSDFEKPPLPDLVITMNVTYSGLTNVTNLTISIANDGQAPAFNIFMDLFDNRTNNSYTKNESEAFLDLGQSISYNYTISDTTNDTLYTSIADFNNYIDEMNESNNIAQNTQEEGQGSSIDVSSLQSIYSSGRVRLFEFKIQNNGASAINGINWSLDTGDNGYIINSTTPVNLTSGEDVYVYAEYNYSSTGTFTVIANATDGSQSDSDTITVSVGELVIEQFDDINVEGTNIVFEFEVKNHLDINITNINWSIDMDNGVVINSTYLFNLTANESLYAYVEYQYPTGGTYAPVLTVTNGTYSDTKTASVTTSSAPVISGLPDVTFFEDEYNDTVNLSNYVTDAEDADEDLIWTAIGNSSDTVRVDILPNKIVNFTSAIDYYNNPNGMNITFIVTDTYGLSDNDTISVIVIAQNDPPTFNGPIPNMTWPEDTLNNSLNLSNYFSDIDNPLIYYSSTQPANITVKIDNTTGMVNLTPNLNFNGLNYIMFSATDLLATTNSNNITLNITPVNDPPSFTGTIPKIEWPEDNINSSLNLTQYFSDIDGDDLNYSNSITENITITINNNTGIVTLTPNTNFYGINHVVFFAYDPDGASNQSNNVTLNVTPVNDAPLMNMPNVTTAEDTSASINMTLYASDPDNEATGLTFTVTAEDTARVNCDVMVNGDNLSMTPAANWYGLANCTVKANDGSLDSNQNMFFINVTSVNDVPELNGTNITIKEDSGTNSSINLTQYAYDVETTATSLTFYVAYENASVDCNINADSHRLDITPAGNYSGAAFCNITASDSEANSTPAMFNINVTPVNDAPVIDYYIPTELTPTVAENSQLQFNHTSSDIDEDSLTYNWTLDNAQKATAQAWLYQPITGDAGSHNVSLTVSDGELTDSITWNVTVTNVSDIDVFELEELYAAATSRIFGFRINNTGSGNLTGINWTLNTGLTTIKSSEFNLTSKEAIFVFAEYNYTQTGDYSVTASATDGTSTDSETISIDITDIELVNLTVLNLSDTERTFEVIIENTLTTNLSEVNWTLNTGLTTITAQQLINLTPNEKLYVYVDYNYTQTGTYNVNATAINGSLTDSRNITITVP